MKLGLGTAQFGLDYGISNRDGQTSESEVRNILSLAAVQGMPVIDTASQYGSSEEIVGRCLPDNHAFRIITKTPSFKKKMVTNEDALHLKETFFTSLQRLRQESIYGLMIHHADDLLSENGPFLWQAMQELKDLGVVEKIGVSVYSPDQLDAVLNLRTSHIDLVQLPLNVLDQRMIHSGALKKLKDLNVEIHSRSVFLQGLLLMDPGTLPVHFANIKQLMMKYREVVRGNILTQIEAALNFASGVQEIDCIIVGVNNARQLQELCAAAHPDALCTTIDFRPYAINDEMIVDPSNWRLSQ
jgi:aryl-alcohol dehydrogenase-like predicted oxidoreductase